MDNWIILACALVITVWVIDAYFHPIVRKPITRLADFLAIPPDCTVVPRQTLENQVRDNLKLQQKYKLLQKDFLAMEQLAADNQDVATALAERVAAMARALQIRDEQLKGLDELRQHNELLQLELSGHTAYNPTPTINKATLDRLIRLCHPSKHNDSPASHEATKWLLDQRPPKKRKEA